ncbi:hypothetical protein F5Y18DRAFT_424955 [Xylariaceae sp. FL1019]|nr:hypothetical protein F5Y18DRAFT_424955 [Xylariaceae sp. FL1019]
MSTQLNNAPGAAGNADAPYTNRERMGKGRCSECGIVVKRLNEHHRERHLGNVCHWPSGTNTDGHQHVCGYHAYDDEKMWDHLVNVHSVIQVRDGRFHCNWPGELSDYPNKHSAERRARFAQHDAFHAAAA